MKRRRPEPKAPNLPELVRDFLSTQGPSRLRAENSLMDAIGGGARAEMHVYALVRRAQASRAQPEALAGYLLERLEREL